MGNVITNLKAKFGVDSSDFKKGLKDGERATEDFKGAAGDTLDQFASMFGLNMGAVNEAIGTAQKSLNFLGTSFKAASEGGNKLAIAMKVVKTALVSTGIGAIVVGLGSLIAYFSKTGEGADKFAKILAQIKSVINNTIERLAVFGKGLWEIMTGKFKQGWETMKGAFKGMGDELREDWKAAGDLADREDALDDREIALINSLEERRAKAAELRLMAREELEDQKKKLDLVTQAENLIKSVYGDEISIEKERLAIMKEKLAIQTKDPTDEQRREVAEQEAKINSLLRAQAEELRSLTREKNAALKIVKEQVELEKIKAEQIGITRAEIDQIKLPDFSQVSNALAPMAEVQKQVKQTMVDITDSITSSLEDMAAGLGEFLGALALGDAGIKDFGAMMAASFAEMAITVGKIVIKAALAVAGIDQALKIPGAWPVALAAGVALVAIGSMVRGALASASSGGGSAAAVSPSSAYTFDTRNTSAASTVNVKLSGTFRIEGKDLVTVIEEENTRKDLST